MSDTELPAGKYLTCTIDVHPDYGGQTRALLMRNRILAAHGVDADVLMVGAAPDLTWRRETLRERGLLTDGIDLLNIHEYYRDTDWPGEEPGETFLDPDVRLTKETSLPDGSPWRRTYRTGDGRVVHDYLRPDGSTFIRVPAFVYKKPDSWPVRIIRVSRDGRVVGAWKQMGGWYRRWLRDVAGEERAFVFMDSRHMVSMIAPMKAPSVHLLYTMHNIHVGDDHRWDSPVGPVYERALERIDDLDAFVTLTDRQRQDIAQRRGRTTNMFVIPNPVDLPPVPESVERDPDLVSVVARLEGQKRLSHAIKAFTHVVREVPDARLEIYGKGSRQASLQRVVDRHGLGASVTLKGHDPHARDALWRSSAFLMTSLYEGYPLSTLESMSHGCPVVSYDIKYGPREQIQDGVDGYLVPEGDGALLAERVVALLRDPGLVGRMSAAARTKAESHGVDRFVSDWAHVLRSVIEQRNRRARLEHVDLTVTRLQVSGGHRPFSGHDARSVPGVHRPDETLRFQGRLAVGPRSKDPDLADASVELAVVHEGTGAVVPLPVKVSRNGSHFELEASVSLADVYAAEPEESGCSHLRLRLVWRNATWEIVIRRPAVGSGKVEVSYDADDTMRLIRRVGTSPGSSRRRARMPGRRREG